MFQKQTSQLLIFHAFLVCIVSEVHGEKVKPYTLATSYGALKGKYRGGDLQLYSGIVESGSLSVVLSLREVARKFNPEKKFLKSNCKCKGGCKNNRCSCKANGIDCSTHCHPASTCTNHQVCLKGIGQTQLPLLNVSDRKILDSNDWLNDTHSMLQANC